MIKVLLCLKNTQGDVVFKVDCAVVNRKNRGHGNMMEELISLSDASFV